MDKSDDENRDAPQGDEPEDRASGTENRDDHTESGDKESEDPSANDADAVPRTDEPLLDAAVQPIADALGELVSIDATPPDAGRTEPGYTSRSRESARGRAARDDAAARSPGSDVPSDEYHVEAERSDDELVVTAELPGVAAEDLFVGLDEEERSLVVAVNGSVIAREFYPWETIEAKRTYFDGPDLEVRLEPADGTASE